MSVLEKIDYEGGSNGLDALLSFGVGPLKQILELLLESTVSETGDALADEKTSAALCLLDDKIEDMEKTIKRFQKEVEAPVPTG